MMYYDTGNIVISPLLGPGKLYYVDTVHSDIFIDKLCFDLH